MRLPGSAWLEFQLSPITSPDSLTSPDESKAGTHIVQRALFEPRGLAGQLYWAALQPFHPLIFSQMIAGIAEAAALNPVQLTAPARGPQADGTSASGPS